nr:phenylalanine--tRNA ligase subunit beta [Desulfobulbaceae bacterium]
MKFTVNWLKQYVDFELSADELADRLTMLGLEVDAVEPLYSGLDQILVSKVVNVFDHPNADKLHLCDVDVGGDIKRVVCGAPNVKAGMLAAIVLPGSTINGFKVKKAKIRGEASEGMLCSEKELGLSDGHGGIMVLPETSVVGQTLTQALDLDDTLIEVDLTPNRPDCTSVIGVAREVAGVVGGSLKNSTPTDLPVLTGSKSFSVVVDAPDDCPRYAARLLKNVTISESPWWLKRILLAVGLRPINNVVDITNFVMLEHGQPLHAFDFNRIAGQKIVVRHAGANEKMQTLDGTVRDLDEQMLLICDAEKPVAIAGVMGGGNSEVSNQTTDILLESAYFNPISVRRTSRTLKLSTDASYRFERGVDPKGTIVALDRAAQLIVELAGGQVDEGGCDCVGKLPENPPIALRLSKVNDLLGTDLSLVEVASFLNGIQIATEVKDDQTLTVFPPSFRVDLDREIDLIEEIARLKGYNEIASTLPTVPMSFSEQDDIRRTRKQLSGIMVSLGLYEAVNYSFISPKHYDMLQLSVDDYRRNSVQIINPLTDDQSVMRTMLLPGLLENVRHNLNRQTSDVALFEIGKVFLPCADQELPDEVTRLCAVFSGRRNPGSSHYHYGTDSIELIDIKGKIETIVNELRLSAASFSVPETGLTYSEKGFTVEVNIADTLIGYMGKVEKSCLKSFGIKQDVFFLDIDITALVKLSTTPTVFVPISKYPSVNWDLALVVPDSVGAGTLTDAILTAALPLVKGAEIFDVYSGKPIEEGFKSVALSITYHSDEQTLDDEKVGVVHQKIIDLVAAKFDGKLREM